MRPAGRRCVLLLVLLRHSIPCGWMPWVLLAFSARAHHCCCRCSRHIILYSSSLQVKTGRQKEELHAIEKAKKLHTYKAPRDLLVYHRHGGFEVLTPLWELSWLLLFCLLVALYQSQLGSTGSRDV